MYKLKIIIVLVLFLEFFLRFYFGFCDTILMQKSVKYEYIAKPNQDRFRFRNAINYNSLSMRSDEINGDAVLILGFGDSVLNGGVLTSNEDLATTLLSKSLTKKMNKPVQFLNISAGSWGPDNCFAYLLEKGDFNAKSIYLFVSSHDAYDTMNFEEIIDKSVSFPSRQYKIAIYELLDRYLLPRIITYEKELGINKKRGTEHFNIGFQSFVDYSKKYNIPLTIYLHAENVELENNSYNSQGQEIIDFAKLNKIPIILELENGLNKTNFRDQIHLNESGQELMAKLVYENIIK
tara:strand:- start:1285 stop:2160 length:876 start_codon:yes stop_codon:yes gene_type:complete